MAAAIAVHCRFRNLAAADKAHSSQDAAQRNGAHERGQPDRAGSRRDGEDRQLTQHRNGADQRPGVDSQKRQSGARDRKG